MGDNKENRNQNNFNDTTNFNGPTQISAGNINNDFSGSGVVYRNAKYTPEPLWRSPFTLALLTWISSIIAILGLFPAGKIFANAFSVLYGDLQVMPNFLMQAYLITFVILALLFTLFFTLRRITKKQIRIPLFLNYAISGYERKLTLEKVHIEECPQCGGKMKYYNKPVEWEDKYYSNGKSRRKVTKKIPNVIGIVSIVIQLIQLKIKLNNLYNEIMLEGN